MIRKSRSYTVTTIYSVYTVLAVISRSSALKLNDTAPEIQDFYFYVQQKWLQRSVLFKNKSKQTAATYYFNSVYIFKFLFLIMVLYLYKNLVVYLVKLKLQ